MARKKQTFGVGNFEVQIDAIELTKYAAIGLLIIAALDEAKEWPEKIANAAKKVLSWLEKNAVPLIALLSLGIFGKLLVASIAFLSPWMIALIAIAIVAAWLGGYIGDLKLSSGNSSDKEDDDDDEEYSSGTLGDQRALNPPKKKKETTGMLPTPDFSKFKEQEGNYRGILK